MRNKPNTERTMDRIVGIARCQRGCDWGEQKDDTASIPTSPCYGTVGASHADKMVSRKIIYWKRSGRNMYPYCRFPHVMMCACGEKRDPTPVRKLSYAPCRVCSSLMGSLHWPGDIVGRYCESRIRGNRQLQKA